MTGAAPSDTLRDVYEQRGGEEYAEPVVPDPTVDRKFAVLVEEIGRLLPVGALLDVACGDGRYLAALPMFGPVPERVVGVDIAESILDTARRATSQAGVAADLVRANLERLPLGDSEFDFVVSIQTIEHLLDPAAGLRELARVLRPGGTLLLSTDNRRNLITWMLNGPRWLVASLLGRRNSRAKLKFPHRSFSRGELDRLMVEAGLVVERVRTFRFSVVGASIGLTRFLHRIDGRLPDLGLGDLIVVVARRPLP